MIIYGSDLSQFYFWIQHFIFSVNQKSLQLLLWSPWNFLGQPFLFNLQYGALNPIFWLSPILGASSFINFIYVISIFTALVGQYSLLHYRFKISNPGSLTGAIIFALNGFIFPRIFAGHLNVIFTYCWLPLILYFESKFINSRKSKHLVFWIISNYLQLTAGFVSLYLMSFLVQIFWLICETTLRRTNIFRLFYEKFIILFITFLLILPVLTSFMEIIGNSQRSMKKDFVFSSSYSFPIENLMTFINPEKNGNPIYLDTNLSKYKYTGPFNYWELSAFVGVSSLILVLWGLFSKVRAKIWFILIGCFSLIMAFGNNTPLFYFIFRYFPIYHLIRIPAQHLYIVVFSLSALASFGYDHLIKQKNMYYLLSVIAIFVAALYSVLNINLYFVL